MTIPRVALDNGHGSNYKGKMSPKLDDSIEVRDASLIEDNRFKEYLFNRKIVDMLINKCSGENWVELYKVVPENTDISLTERKRRINKFSPHISISIHANAIGFGETWEKAKGFGVWTSRGETEADQYAEILYNNFAAFYQGEIKILRDTTDGDSDYEANFAMNMVNCPAVLMETAFYTNRDDLQTMMSDRFQQNYVTILRNSLIDIRKTIAA